MSDQAKTTGAGATAGAAADPAPAPAPAPPDEFAHIPTPRTRHPVLAAAAAALAFFLVYYVRSDLRYALSPGTPLDLGGAHTLFQQAGSAGGHALESIENRYVHLRGTPDRESALELDTKGSWTFSQFFRVLGTGDRIFLHRRESPLPTARAEEDAFEGRLIRFRDLSFQDSIRAYFTRHVTATHFFAPADVVRAAANRPPRGDGSIALPDRAGDIVSVQAADELAIDVVRPGEVRLGLPRERFADKAAARAAIEKEGGQIVSDAGLVKEEARDPASMGALPLASGPPPTERWTFVVTFPADKRDAALSTLGDLDPKVSIRDARETLRLPLGQLGSAGEETLIVNPAAAAPPAVTEGAPATAPPVAPATPRTLPVASIAAVRTVATVAIPDDAFLVIEGDHPREHVSTVFIAVVLAMFGAINLVGLVRELRRR